MRYKVSTELPVPVQQAFAYHERPGCLSRLTPPWEKVTVHSSDRSLAVGSRVVLKTSLFGVPLLFRARHVEYDPPNLFADVLDSGPFSVWRHEHRFTEIASHSSALTDDIHFELPAGLLGRMAGGTLATRKLESMFAYRHRITRDDLSLVQRYPCQPRTIAISGASGLLGNALTQLLTLLGHRVIPIVRHSSASEDQIAIWGAESEAEKLRCVDVVVHLAGKPIASGRWSESVKRQLRESRVDVTRKLCERIANVSDRPSTLICASATGMYGDRGDEMLNEQSGPGTDFLANVCREWEASCAPARDAGVRVVHARFGLVLSPLSGALQKMLTPAKLLGGRLGSGQQWWSWIALEDALGAIVHAIETSSISGAVNFVSPEPIRNRDFASTLGDVLRRPALFPAPASALRLLMGEMADVLLLGSTRVVPERLLETGYQFRFTSLTDALRFYLGKERLLSE